MRIRSAHGLAALVAVALAVALLVVTAGSDRHTMSAEATSAPVDWQGLVGEPRPDVSVGQLSLVVLEAPSLSERVAAAGGRVSDRQERTWTRSVLAAQRQFITRMGLQGAQISTTFNFTRVLNGFAAPLDPRAIALLERAPEVEGVYPVRAAYPAAASSAIEDAFAPGTGRRPDAGLPGFDGRGVTVALLDTGVDAAQPILRGRIQPGIDVVDGEDDALAAPKPDDGSQLERHGTQLAGLLVGAGGPGGLAGVATGASILPIRIAGWQRDTTGAWTVFSRTDQIIAGLERAVDPSGDGDAHDAARVALVGVAEPFAAFADGPLAHAAAGATRLDTLVVAPAGNDGPAGPGFGSVAGPGGAPAALTVGAADLRPSTPQVRVVLRAGLEAVLDRVEPLGGGFAPAHALELELAGPRLPAPDAAPSEQAAALGLGNFFDARGYSRVAGKAALVPGGEDAGGTVRAAARAGAAAVLVYGRQLPPGSLGIDERVPVPVVDVPAAAARTMLRSLGRAVSTGVSLGAPQSEPSATVHEVAPFSSRGLSFDGRVKPELSAAGVELATSEPGANEDGSARYGTVNGSSAAAAVVAGSAALLAQARPELGAAALKSLLVSSARPLPHTSVAAQGAGVVDVGAAATTELATQPATLALGRANRPGWTSRRRLIVRNVSSRSVRVRVSVVDLGFSAARAEVTVSRKRLVLRPGATARFRVAARVARPPRGGPAAEGVIVLTPVGGRALRIPFAIAFDRTQAPLLEGIALSDSSFEPSDTQPSVLSLLAGRVTAAAGSEEVEPVERLDIELWTEDGKRIGVIARQRNLLPGRYTFGITGRDPGGAKLKPGRYRLRILAFPTPGGRRTARSLRFTIE